ncbi:MAG: RnfABCDGE type electron transport complex subunit D [Phycisphaerae bacterium]|jgi:electron transport complex protein RnfD
MSQADSVPPPPEKPAEPAPPPAFHVASSPHLSEGTTTRRIMFEVVLAMLPLLAVAIYMYRLSALVLVVTTVAGCLVAEAAANWIRGRRQSSLADGSAIVTGMILAFSLPPSMATSSKFYMAFIGGIVAIALAKAVFGGLGQNLFNPAMVGRAFLMICFPAAMVLWSHTAPMKAAGVDATSTATPLYQAAKLREFVGKAQADPDKAEEFVAEAEKVRQEMPGLWQLLIGNVRGCVGETSALIAFLAGMYLVIRRVADWRMPVGVLGSVAVFTTILYLIDSGRYANPLYQLTSGALMFGAFFIATDYVGAPVTPRGRWVFAVGVGVLVVLIRVFGVYPEGFMFAILIMNALTPLIERWTVPTPFGGKVPAA